MPIKPTFLRSLIAALALLPTLSQAQASAPMTDPAADLAVVPEVSRPPLREARYPSQDFEISLHRGQYLSRYYGVTRSNGLRIAYHLNEDFYVEASAGETTMSSKGLRVREADGTLSDGHAPLSYADLSVAYNGLLPGELFVFGKYKFLTSGYLSGGVGQTRFQGRDELTLLVGGGSRLYLSRNIVLRSDVRGHMYTITRGGQRKSTQNGEATVSLGFIF